PSGIGHADAGAPDAGAPDAGAECDASAASAPECFDACGSDWIRGEARCEGGSWKCEVGILATSCPPGVCWGLPTQAEVCGTHGWECPPSPEDWNTCPELLCPECSAFTDATVDGCFCHCTNGEVRCRHSQ